LEYDDYDQNDDDEADKEEGEYNNNNNNNNNNRRIARSSNQTTYFVYKDTKTELAVICTLQYKAYILLRCTGIYFE
jgi:hypothetical protein